MGKFNEPLPDPQNEDADRSPRWLAGRFFPLSVSSRVLASAVVSVCRFFKESLAPLTGPDGRVVMQPGQIVRYILSKDETNMFGLVQSVQDGVVAGGAAANPGHTASGGEGGGALNNASGSEEGGESSKLAGAPSKEATVTFYFRTGQSQVSQAMKLRPTLRLPRIRLAGVRVGV